MKSFARTLAAFAAGVAFCASPALCSAEIVEGQAPIIDGNTAQAAYAARQDAMRTFVEGKVGVHVQSSTEVDLGMVVADHILTNSNGYVQVKNVVDQKQVGGIYIVRLDLEADAHLIATAVEDVKSRLEGREENSSRHGVVIAVGGRDENGRFENIPDINNYVGEKMQDKGFVSMKNEAVLQYMAAHRDLDDPNALVEIRRIARKDNEYDEDRGEAHALLRGTLSTQSITRQGNSYVATVHASFELIGLDSNISNSFENYFTASASTPDGAKRNARNMAAREAVDALGQQALKTDQRENRGGVHHIKMTMVFRNLGNPAERSQQIVAALSNMGIHIIRFGLTSSGNFQAFVDATQFQDKGALQMAIMKNLGCSPLTDEGDTIGSSKLQFTF